MTIIMKRGDMLHDAKSGYLVHGCNCQGKMGSGIAVGVREVYPLAYGAYMHTFNAGNLQLGSIVTADVGNNRVVVNAMTQGFYKGHHLLPSESRYVDYEAVASCFELINEQVMSSDVTPKIVHFPLIGAGLAGGNWDIIKVIIDETLDDSIEKVLWLLP